MKKENFIMKKISKKQSIEILGVLEFVLLSALLYCWISFRYRNIDLTLIGFLTIVALSKKKLLKEQIFFNKKVAIIGLLWILYLTFNFYQSVNIDLTTKSAKEIFYITIVWKSIFLTLVISQIKFKDYVYKIVPILALIFSISAIFRGIKFLFKVNIFADRNLWKEVWLNPNYYSMILGIIIIISITLIYYNEKNKIRALAIVIALTSASVLVLGPRSRNVIIAIVLVLLMQIIKKMIIEKVFNKKKLMVFLFAVVFLVVGINNYKKELRFSEERISQDGRVLVYAKGIDVIREMPLKEHIVGKGFYYYIGGKIITAREQLSAFHNEILSLYITQGIIGTLFYLIFFMYIIYLLTRNNDEEYRVNNVLSMNLTLYFLLIGMFDDVLHNMRIPCLVFFFIGIALSSNNILIRDGNRDIIV